LASARRLASACCLASARRSVSARRSASALAWSRRAARSGASLGFGAPLGAARRAASASLLRRAPRGCAVSCHLSHLYRDNRHHDNSVSHDGPC
jgi:hypothetical protein